MQRPGLLEEHNGGQCSWSRVSVGGRVGRGLCKSCRALWREGLGFYPKGVWETWKDGGRREA